MNAQPESVIYNTKLEGFSEEERALREFRLREESDNRTPLEKLFDFISAARLAFYRPDQPPVSRQDIICLCCGRLYRPDDVMDGENIFICSSCILTRRGG